MKKDRSSVQLIWGIALVLAGIGVFIRLPQVMPKIEQVEQFVAAAFYIRFCFYFIGIVLIAGGTRKIYLNYPKK